MALTPAQIAATEYFDEKEYVLSKAKIMVLNGKFANEADAKTHFESKWTGDMIDHYLQYGYAENANPSNNFDNTKYYETVAAATGKTYTEVRAELLDAGISPLKHYLETGKDLGYAASPVTGSEVVDPGDVAVEGTTYTLTSGTDRGDAFTGTNDNDTYNAWLEQNSMAGGVSNSLSSADRLDGGAGNDVLNAELVTEFVGADTGYNIDVQPTTANIEEVRIEARDFSNAPGNIVTLDAKNMKDIVKIGSLNSDGDLVIENLTTLTSAGEIRKPGDLTITMDHTDNFNSDGDASDLTVYFDEDYLVTSTSTQGSSLTVKINNVLNIREGNNPVENFSAINFTVGTTAVAVDITGSTTYDDVVNKINAELTAQGLTSVVASKATAENVYFSMDIGGYSAGSLAGTYNPIIITNTGSETLTKGTIELAQGQTDGDINNTWTATDATTSVQPTSINIELNKVGRDGDGGNLIIGGKDQDNAFDTDKDQQDGIDIFNIKVMGNDDKPSNLGFIQSTNNTLNTVNVANGTGWDGADLTVNTRLGEGQELNLIDSTGFSGDFSLAMAGPGQQALTSNFGSGNDMYNWMSVETDANDDDDKGYSINMGGGNDTVVANLDGDSVDALGESFNLMTGAGNDTVTVDMAAGVSYQTMTNIGAMQATYLEINTGAGDDRVMLDDYGTFDIVAAGGNDYVEIDANDATDLSGNWTIFNNTGFDTFGARVLYNAKMTVSFAGFETTIDINTTSTGNYVATQAFIASEIKRAIEDDATLNEFLTVNIAAGSNQVEISSDIDGANSLAIAIYQPELITSGTPTAAQTLIDAADVTNLRQGLIATEATINNDSTLLESADEIATWVSANNWEGQVDQTGLGDNSIAYSAAQLTNDTAEVAPDSGADLLDQADFLGYNTGGSADDAGALVNFSTIDAGAGDDIIVLDSNAGSINTIVVSGSFGYDRVVNFHDVATNAVDTAAEVGDHMIDYSTFLTDTVDASGAGNVSGEDSDSTVLADTNVILANGARSFADAPVHGATTGTNIDANDVAIVRFDSSVANATTETFANLTGADLVNALNGDFDTTGDSAYGNLAAGTLEAVAVANYTNTTQNHIIMIENDLNEGEYKVFHVTSTIDSTTNAVTDGDFAVATELGTFDFGASVNLAIAQEESVKASFMAAVAAATNSGGETPTDTEAPTMASQTFSIAENSANGSSVGTVQATDNVGIVSYELSGTDAFAVNSAGQLTVADSAALDYETTPQFTFSIKASDAAGNYTTSSMTVNLTDVDETPQPGVINLTEGTTAPVAATDAADQFTFDAVSALAMSDNTQIQITGFNASADSLQLDIATAGGVTTLADLNGVDGIAVQTNGITQTTLINFGNDADGDVVSLELAGITDASTIQIEAI